MVLCMSFISCSDVETSTSGQQDGAGAISFSTKITSRVSGSSFDTGDMVSIASYEDGTLVDEWVEYKWDGSMLSSDNYIQKEYKIYYSYIATYPAKTSATFNHAIIADQSSDKGYDRSDLLVAHVATTRDEEIRLDFYHILAQLNITIDINDTRSNKEEVTVENLYIYSPAGASVYCDVEYELYTTDDSAITITPAKISDLSYSAILAPQYIDKGVDLMTVVINGEKVIWSSGNYYTFKSGMEYSSTWSITLSDDAITTEEVTISELSLNDWSSGGDVE